MTQSRFRKKPELGINKDSQNDAITDFINAAPDAKVKENRATSNHWFSKVAGIGC